MVDTLADNDFDWQPATNHPSQSRTRSAETTDDTPTAIDLGLTIADNSFVDYAGTVVAVADDGTTFAVDVRGAWKKVGGTVSQVRAPSAKAPEGQTNPGGWSAALGMSSGVLKVNVVGPALSRVLWHPRIDAQVAKLPTTAIDRTTLPLSLFLKDFAGPNTWGGTASAGSSASHSPTEATNPPAVGPALNGLDSAEFDGANDQLLDTSTLGSDYLDDESWSFWGLIDIDAIVGTSDVDTGPYGNEAIVALSNDYWGIHLRDTGAGYEVQVYQTEAPSGNARAAVLGVALGTKLLIQGKYSVGSGKIRARVNSGMWSEVSSDPMYGSLSAARLKIGRSGVAAHHFAGIIHELAISKTCFTDAECDGIKADVNAEYGTAL